MDDPTGRKVLNETPITPSLGKMVGRGWFMLPMGVIEIPFQTIVHFNCLASGSWVGGWALDYVEYKPTRLPDLSGSVDTKSLELMLNERPPLPQIPVVLDTLGDNLQGSG
jgi:hypothetical protein